MNVSSLLEPDKIISARKCLKVHYWTQTQQWQSRRRYSHGPRGVGWVQGTANTRPRAALLSFAWLTVQSVSIWVREWGAHCLDEQKSVKEAHSHSRQLAGFSCLFSFAMVSLFLWFLSLCVTPYRPTSRSLLNNLWISIISDQLMTVARWSRLLFGSLLCS